MIDLGMKARTKSEMYRLLTVDADLYLPPQREASIYFIREIIMGRKRYCYSKFKFIGIFSTKR